MALGLDSARMRKVGTFVLIGKTKEIVVYEIHDADSPWPIELDDFDAALVEFQSGNWEGAKRLFHLFGADHPNDGPVRFCQKLLHTYDAGLHGPSAGWSRGVIDLNEKRILAELVD